MPRTYATSSEESTPDTPGGSNTDIQYNDSGAFGGDGNLTWNKVAQQQVVEGAGNDTIGSGNSTLRLLAVQNAGAGQIILDFFFQGGNNQVGTLRHDGGYLTISSYVGIVLGGDQLSGVWPTVFIECTDFQLRTVNNSGNFADLSTSLLTTSQNYTFPDASGTFMLTASGTGQFSDNETPSGTINGSNTAFTLANAPNPAASLMLFLNGQFLSQGHSYTLSGTTITMTTAPAAAFSTLPFKAFYRY